MFPSTRNSCIPIRFLSYNLIWEWSLAPNNMRSWRKVGNLSYVSSLLEVTPLKSIGGGLNVWNYYDQVSSLCKCLSLVRSTNDFLVVTFETFGVGVVPMLLGCVQTFSLLLVVSSKLCMHLKLQYALPSCECILKCSMFYLFFKSLLTWMGPSKVKWTAKWLWSMFKLQCERESGPRNGHTR